MEIRTAAVIGAGTMGSGIAAHIANAGVPVLLLDIVPEGAADRSALARGAVARLLKADPAPFMSRAAARLVEPGNLEDDLARLAEADWIVEAVVEDPRVKRDLYARIAAAKRPGAIVSSNTSTIPLKALVKDLSPEFRAGFLITHFFNPPRYMRLLEVVAGPDTRDEAVEAVRAFADLRLGKGVVMARDTPGFVANRIGVYWLQTAINAAFDLGLTVEEADAVMGRPLGFPKTGVFGLLDLVGIDLVPAIARSLLATLPPDDPYRAAYRDHPLITRMIADGCTGRKGKGGFYRPARHDGARVKESIDLAGGGYARSEQPRLDAVEAAKRGGPRALLEHPDRAGQYAWRVLSATLAYAAALAPQIADDIAAVDQAMRLGYNWQQGPFELIDRLGADRLAARLEAEGRAVPPLLQAARAGGFYRVEHGRLLRMTFAGDYAPLVRPAGVLLLGDVKRAGTPLLRNPSAALWDIGDGVTCFEFTTPMNTLDTGTMALLEEAVALTAGRYRAMVIHNEGENFSIGANLGQVLFAANIAFWSRLEEAIAAGQRALKAVKYAPVPVVGAPSGMALGGGCEMLLHCAAIQAHAESYIGLVEAGVGVVPAWGGCTELLLRHAADPDRPGGPMPPINRAFEAIALARLARSAAEARDMRILRRGDGITMNRDRLLADAKARAVALADGYRPPAPPVPLHLPGRSAQASLAMAVDGFRRLGRATPHDAAIAAALAMVLSGGNADLTDETNEDTLRALECQAFLALIRTPATLARMAHMLNTGKPLRN